MATKSPWFKEAHQGREARRAAPARLELLSLLALHQACVGPATPGRAREFMLFPRKVLGNIRRILLLAEITEMHDDHFTVV